MTQFTDSQAEILSELWPQLQGMLAQELRRRHLLTILDDILSDSITRLSRCIVGYNLNSAPAIVQRWKYCCLDAIESAARQHSQESDLATRVASLHASARHNGEPIAA